MPKFATLRNACDIPPTSFQHHRLAFFSFGFLSFSLCSLFPSEIPAFPVHTIPHCWAGYIFLRSSSADAHFWSSDKALLPENISGSVLKEQTMKKTINNDQDNITLLTELSVEICEFMRTFQPVFEQYLIGERRQRPLSWQFWQPFRWSEVRISDDFTKIDRFLKSLGVTQLKK